MARKKTLDEKQREMFDAAVATRKCQGTRHGGLPCRMKPVKGTTLCAYHGGNAAKRRAAIRILGLADSAIDTLDRIINTESKAKPTILQLAAAKDILDRSGMKTPDEALGATVVDYSMYTDEEIEQLEKFALKQRLAPAPESDSHDLHLHQHVHQVK